MSEKNGPFDNVVEVLRHSAFSITDAEAEAAIRVLIVAGRVEKETVLSIDKKSILSDAAYTGGGCGKRWLAERGNYICGFNDCYNKIMTPEIRALLESLPDKEE